MPVLTVAELAPVAGVVVMPEVGPEGIEAGGVAVSGLTSLEPGGEPEGAAAEVSPAGG